MQDSAPAARSSADFASHRSAVLLVALLSFLLIQPLLPAAWKNLSFASFTTVVILGGVFSLHDRQRQLIVALALGGPFFLAVWGDALLGGSEMVGWLRALSALAFFGYTTIILLRRVLGAARVTADTLCGAACVYLLVGMTWTFAYMLVVAVHPESIVRSSGGDPVTAMDCAYFSFVTLTTLGYGDIAPVSLFARSLAIVEAVSGVLYLALLVARLVAMFQHPGDPSEDTM